MQKARRGLFWGQVGEVLQNINLRTRVHERNNITRLSHILNLSKTSAGRKPDPLRQLDHRARVVLSLFADKEKITSAEMASALGLSVRMVRVLLTKWVEEGWLIAADPSNRGRAYILSAIYRQPDAGISKAVFY